MDRPAGRDGANIIEQISDAVSRVTEVPHRMAMDILTRMDTHESMHDDINYENHLNINRELRRAESRQPVIGDDDREVFEMQSMNVN